MQSIHRRMGRLLAAGLVAVMLMVGVADIAPNNAGAVKSACMMAMDDLDWYSRMANIAARDGNLSAVNYYQTRVAQAQAFLDANC